MQDEEVLDVVGVLEHQVVPHLDNRHFIMFIE